MRKGYIWLACILFWLIIGLISCGAAGRGQAPEWGALSREVRINGS